MDKNISKYSIITIISIFSITNDRDKPYLHWSRYSCCCGHDVHWVDMSHKKQYISFYNTQLHMMQVCMFMFNTITLSLYRCNINTFEAYVCIYFTLYCTRKLSHWIVFVCERQIKCWIRFISYKYCTVFTTW